MADEAMYDEMETPVAESEEQSVANDTNEEKGDEKSDETEDQLSLVPKHFFKDEMKPGDREMVEVVEAYEGEYSIKCLYGEGDETDREDASSETTENEPTDAAYE